MTLCVRNTPRNTEDSSYYIAPKPPSGHSQLVPMRLRTSECARFECLAHRRDAGRRWLAVGVCAWLEGNERRVTPRRRFEPSGAAIPGGAAVERDVDGGRSEPEVLLERRGQVEGVGGVCV